MSVSESDEDIGGNLIEDSVCASILEMTNECNLALLVLSLERLGETSDQGFLDDGFEGTFIGEEVDDSDQEEELTLTERFAADSGVFRGVAHGILDSDARVAVQDPVGQEVNGRSSDIVVVLSDLNALTDLDLVVVTTDKLGYAFELDLGNVSHRFALGLQDDDFDATYR